MAIDYELIGKRLKKAREDISVTQEKLAEHLNVSNAYISKIERGKTSLNLNTFSQICDYLGVSMSSMLTGSNSSLSDYMRSDIAELIKQCSPAKINLIAKIIKEVSIFQE